MKTPLLLLPLLASTLLAQSNVAPPVPGSTCGTDTPNFKLKTDDDASVPPARLDMSTIVFIEDDITVRPGHSACIGCSSRTFLGMDGSWIAANDGFAHTTIFVSPGDHHLCVSATGPAFRPAPLRSMYALHLDAGKVYFLRARVNVFPSSNISVLDLSLLNEDEGRYLVSISKRTLFSTK
jgi:hypothetical protein